MSKAVIDYAKRFVGLHECKPNTEWTSKSIPGCEALSEELIEIMSKTGWVKSWPYCAAFVDGVYREIYKNDPVKLAIIKKCLGPSVMTMFRDSKKYFTKTPTPGSIFIMQKASGGNGHAGLVGDAILKDSFSTIEGNTSPAPTTAAKDREGDGIYAKVRKLNFVHSDGLHLLGFIDFKF